MNNFEYAEPRSEADLLAALADYPTETEILAGGSDLVGLLKRMVVTPRRVVNVLEIPSFRELRTDDQGRIWIGCGVRLAEFLDHRETDAYPAAKQVLQNISSVQRRAQGTIGGELCRRPACWYFRAGHGLLADEGRRIVQGDNRYHAIFGNDGPAKFVSASRLAPTFIALGAEARVVGPEPNAEAMIPLATLFRTPESDTERELSLGPGQAITHVVLPPDQGALSAAYEVLHGVGPDPPLAAAAVSLDLAAGLVRSATIVLGHVAPVPWLATRAMESLVGRSIDEQSAREVGWQAVADAQPLSQNEYKVQLAAVAVERALLLASGHNTGVV